MVGVRKLGSGGRPVLRDRDLRTSGRRDPPFVCPRSRPSGRLLAARVVAHASYVGGFGRRSVSWHRAGAQDSHATMTWGNGATVPSLRVYVVSVSSVKMIAALPLNGLIATSNRSSRFRVPRAQPVPKVQITPMWFGCADTVAWVSANRRRWSGRGTYSIRTSDRPCSPPSCRRTRRRPCRQTQRSMGGPPSRHHRSSPIEELSEPGLRYQV